MDRRRRGGEERKLVQLKCFSLFLAALLKALCSRVTVE